MVYTGTLVETLAAFFSVVLLIRIVLIYILKIKPSSKILDKLFKNKLLPYCYLVLFVLCSWIILGEITIAQYMFALVTFACFFAYFAVLYPKQTESMTKAVFKDPKHDWLVFGISAIISLWTLWFLFVQ